MKLGYIGLGKMGMNMVERLLEKGYDIVVNNRSIEPVDEAVLKGAVGAYSISELVEKIEIPRIIWLMVPHSAVDSVLEELVPLLNEGDIVIDGGNSNFKETLKRFKILSEKNIKFMDVGVSGGPNGARNGACMMIGGNKEDYQNLEDLFKDLSVENGFGYMGPNGSGHFVKMVHNGIEYGMMQAIGEGFEIMKNADQVLGGQLDLSKITEVYNNGSVIESRLIEWLSNAYKKYGTDLENISGEVSHSGEGEWTVEIAKKIKVPAENIEQSLEFRKKSQGNPSYTGKVVSALRGEFGGHDVKK